MPSDERDQSDQPMPEENVSEDDEPNLCPFCNGSGGCEHQILVWGLTDSIWDGVFADKTWDAQTDLIEALWTAIKTRGEEAVKKAAAKWDYPLSALAKQALGGIDDDEPRNCDWDTIVQEYWIELAEDAGCFRHDWDSEGGPGCSGAFLVLFDNHPETTIASIIEACKRDTETLRCFATPVSGHDEGKTQGPKD